MKRQRSGLHLYTIITKNDKLWRCDETKVKGIGAKEGRLWEGDQEIYGETNGR